MKRLLIKFPGESSYRQEGFILDPNLPADKKRIEQLKNMGLEVKLECLRDQDYLQ